MNKNLEKGCDYQNKLLNKMNELMNTRLKYPYFIYLDSGCKMSHREQKRTISRQKSILRFLAQFIA